MPLRQFILAAALGVALIGFCCFLVADLHASIVGTALFGGAYFALAVFFLRRRALQQGASGGPRLFRVWMVSYAVAGASLMVLALLSMPLMGFKAFELLDTPWFPTALALATLCLYPFVARHLK
jgi:hypothetical protein